MTNTPTLLTYLALRVATTTGALRAAYSDALVKSIEVLCPCSDPIAYAVTLTRRVAA